MSGWRIARIGGIDVHVDPSFLVIVLLLASNIYVGLQDPFRFPALTTRVLYSLSILSAFLFFLSILAHELAHAGMSRALRIHVAGIVLYMFGGATYTAAEERGPSGEFLTTIVGPATSAALGGLFIWIHQTVPLDPALDFVVLNLGRWNILLAIFNAVPIFPLDGGRLLRSTIWAIARNRYQATVIAARTSQTLSALLVAFAVLRTLREQDVGWIWMGFIGVMLFRTATGALAEARQRRALDSATAGQVMSPPPPVVPSDVSVGDARARFLDGHAGEAFPVVTGGTVVGFVSLTTVEGFAPDRPVLEATVPPTAVATVSAGDTMEEVVSRLQQDHIAAVLVMDRGELVGVIEARDVNRFLKERV
jgi:Zn-dependent protease/predicted transcriptional regulator